MKNRKFNFTKTEITASILLISVSLLIFARYIENYISLGIILLIVGTGMLYIGIFDKSIIDPTLSNFRMIVFGIGSILIGLTLLFNLIF